MSHVRCEGQLFFKLGDGFLFLTQHEQPVGVFQRSLGSCTAVVVVDALRPSETRRHISAHGGNPPR